MRMWVYSPHSGGQKPKPAVQDRIRERILKHAAKNYAGRYDRIDVRFRGALCYVDAYVGSSPHPTHLVRLRHNGNESSMSVACYTYSHEAYQATFFADGSDHGTPEDAFDIGAIYLD
jgi:hypothetical protein